MSITVSARAKINLALNITGVRADGYHLLETVMQSVSIEDTVTVAISENKGETEIDVSHDDIPSDGRNIAVLAAENFFKTAGLENPGIRIKIKKKIPVSAGLGGGSADAAAVILALDKLLKAELSDDDLIRAAEKTGADVPFCLYGGTMLAEGTGSILTPLPPLPDCYIVIVKAGEKGSTAEMYKKYDSHASPPKVKISLTTDAVCLGDLQQLGQSCDNVFLSLWSGSVPEKIVEEFLAFGALGSGLSGSGPSVFGIFDDKSAAEKALSEIRKNAYEAFLCRPLPSGCEFSK